jgi:hypothetical protein
MSNEVTVADGWTVEAQSEHIMRITEVGKFSLPIDRVSHPFLFVFLQALHAEHFELEGDEDE